MGALQLSNMGWCQAIVLVAFVGILQCDLSQTARCNCSNRIIQFRIPILNNARNYPYFSLPYPYVNANYKPYTNQQKCNTPRCNTKVQPEAVKISIPTASKNGWANIIIDTKNANVTTTNQNQGPQKSNLTIVVQVGNSNKGKKNNATEPAVSAQTDVSATNDKDGKYIKSKSSTKNSNADIEVVVDVAQMKSDGGDGNNYDDIIMMTDAFVKDSEDNEAQAVSGVVLTDEASDGNNQEEASPDAEPQPKPETPVTKDDDATAGAPDAGDTTSDDTTSDDTTNDDTTNDDTTNDDTTSDDTTNDDTTSDDTTGDDTTSDDEDKAAATGVSEAGTDGKGKSKAGSGSAATTSDGNGSADAAGASTADTDGNGNSEVASGSAAAAKGDNSDAKSSSDAETARGKGDSTTATDSNAATTTADNTAASDSDAGTTSGKDDSTASSDTDSAAKTGDGTS